MPSRARIGFEKSVFVRSGARRRSSTEAAQSAPLTTCQGWTGSATQRLERLGGRAAAAPAPCVREAAGPVTTVPVQKGPPMKHGTTDPRVSPGLYRAREFLDGPFVRLV